MERDDGAERQRRRGCGAGSRRTHESICRTRSEDSLGAGTGNDYSRFRIPLARPPKQPEAGTPANARGSQAVKKDRHVMALVVSFRDTGALYR
jgi:hypothetical protein